MQPTGPTPASQSGAAFGAHADRARGGAWRPRWTLVFACWTVLALLFFSQSVVYYTSRGEPIPWRGLLVVLSDSYAWAALSGIVFWFARRFPFDRKSWPRALAVHIPASLAVTLLQLALVVSVDSLISTVSGEPSFLFRRSGTATSFPGKLLELVFRGYSLNLLTYWVLVGISHAVDYYRLSRERTIRASQLETRLAQAQLQVLKMQLHPHFLFNTLHAISTLVHEDAKAADRMITRLSDLLRLTLDSAGRQEVSLKQELEFLTPYLEIEQARFQDRLSVQLDIEPETLDASVPNLILQPLVENAIHHGIAPQAGPGRIAIRARRRDGRLRVEVEDNGKGLPAGWNGYREGVGLGNTRARLQQLYGEQHRFQLKDADGGGLRVTFEIPLREDHAPAVLGS